MSTASERSMTMQYTANPSTPEHIAYRSKMRTTIEAISNWIADHGPVNDPDLAAWVLEQVEPMLTDGITIHASEGSNGWWSYSFRYPDFVQPTGEATPEPESTPE